ncbi:MAG: Gx transporter family protein [Filifactoraceae bacterium]
MSKSKNIAKYGILISLAMIFSYIERLIPFDFGLPGVKLGLANVVVVIALYTLGINGAMAISIVRVILSGFLFGTLASILFSLSGAVFSIIAMIVGKKINKLSIVGVSILGGVFHNMGQLIIAIWVIGSIKIALYGPVLIMTGLGTGLLIGLIATMVTKKLKVN